MVKEGQKIGFEELIAKGWIDTGSRFADTIVMTKENERLLYEKARGIIFFYKPLEEKNEPPR